MKILHLDSSHPPTGGRGVGMAPSHGKGLGMGSGLNAAEAVRRFPGPPYEDPPQVPLTQGRGLRGSAVGRPAHRLPLHGRRSPAADVPARLAQRLQRSRPHLSSSGDPAAGVTPSAATGATVEPLRALLGLRGPATGLASARGGDLAGQARSAADQDRPVRQAGRSHAVGRKAARGPRAREGRPPEPRVRSTPRQVAQRRPRECFRGGPGGTPERAARAGRRGGRRGAGRTCGP